MHGKDSMTSKGVNKKASSQLSRELSNLFQAQQILLYKGLTHAPKLTEESESQLYHRMTIRAESAKKAVKSSAPAEVATRKVMERYVYQEKDDSQHSMAALLVIKAFHVWFRFFLPLMLLRWSVDIALAWTELALALTKDFVRSGPVTTGLKILNASDLNITHEKTTDPASKKFEGEVEYDERIRRSRSLEDRFLFASLFDVVRYFVTLAYFGCKMCALFIIIPLLSYQFYFLEACSNTLHKLAGLDNGTAEQYENGKANNSSKSPLGNEYLPLTKLSNKKWLADYVLNRITSSLHGYPVVGLFMEMLGVERHPSFFRKMHKSIVENMRIINIKCPGGVPPKLLTVVTDINRYIEGDIAPYLNLDHTYNEDNDPDYVPGDSSEDSLDDEELESTRNDDHEPSAGQENNNVGSEHATFGTENYETLPGQRKELPRQDNKQEAPANGTKTLQDGRKTEETLVQARNNRGTKTIKNDKYTTRKEDSKQAAKRKTIIKLRKANVDKNLSPLSYTGNRFEDREQPKDGTYTSSIPNSETQRKVFMSCLARNINPLVAAKEDRELLTRQANDHVEGATLSLNDKERRDKRAKVSVKTEEANTDKSDKFKDKRGEKNKQGESTITEKGKSDTDLKKISQKKKNANEEETDIKKNVAGETTKEKTVEAVENKSMDMPEKMESETFVEKVDALETMQTSENVENVQTLESVGKIEKETTKFKITKEDEIDPDIAALLASNTQLDTVSVRAGRVNKALGSPQKTMFDIEENTHTDPVNLPLPPSPALSSSPTKRMRHASGKVSRRCCWPGHQVDTITEEDEQGTGDDLDSSSNNAARQAWKDKGAIPKCICNVKNSETHTKVAGTGQQEDEVFKFQSDDITKEKMTIGEQKDSHPLIDKEVASVELKSITDEIIASDTFSSQIKTIKDKLHKSNEQENVIDPLVVSQDYDVNMKSKQKRPESVSTPLSSLSSMSSYDDSENKRIDTSTELLNERHAEKDQKLVSGNSQEVGKNKLKSVDDNELANGKNRDTVGETPGALPSGFVDVGKDEQTAKSGDYSEVDTSKQMAESHGCTDVDTGLAAAGFQE